ncbi:hypothetical protein, partial [Vibrio anguillarum]
AKTKQPYQEQIDGLCNELGITEKQYTDKTTIPELEAIIDKLEAQLPDDEETEQSNETEQLSDTELVDVSQPDEQLVDEIQDNEVEITLTDDLPDDTPIDESDLDVEVNSDEAEQLEVIAKSTFVYEVDGQRHTVVKGTRKFVPKDVAMDALSVNV